MSGYIDFSFTVKLPPAGEHRIRGYVTSKGDFRLESVNVGYTIHVGFKYQKGEYIARGESILYASCPPYLKKYVNSPDFRKAVAAELQRIAKRFALAADRQRSVSRDAGEGGAS